MTWREEMDAAYGHVVTITVARRGEPESHAEGAPLRDEDMAFTGRLFSVHDDGEAVLDPCDGGVEQRTWVWPVLALEVRD